MGSMMRDRASTASALALSSSPLAKLCGRDSDPGVDDSVKGAVIEPLEEVEDR
jgi:hypothetical protein